MFPTWQRVLKGSFAGICIIFLFLGFQADLANGAAMERVEAPSWNPVGSGARALGMGGAFIAVADDATAASWNPGGLIQLERPEISAVGAYFYRVEDNTFGAQPENNNRNTMSNTSLNYLSAVYPFNAWGHNMVVSLNYQSLYDFTREWNFKLHQVGGSLDLMDNVSYEATGDLGAIGLAYCIQISPTISIGATFNIWTDELYDNGWEYRTDSYGNGTAGAGLAVNYTFKSVDKFSFNGLNANLGFLWNATGRLTIGGVFKTPFRADVDHESMTDTYLEIDGVPQPGSGPSYSKDQYKIDMPMSYGLGVAYRFSDEYTMSLDVYRTEWDDFVVYNPDGTRVSAVSGKEIGVSEISASTQVRMGAEYLFIRDKYVIPLRGGIFADPAPAEGSPDWFFGFTAGSGIAYGRFIFDMAYQYRFSNNVNEFILESQQFSQDIQEHTVYASVILHF